MAVYHSVRCSQMSRCLRAYDICRSTRITPPGLLSMCCKMKMTAGQSVPQ